VRLKQPSPLPGFALALGYTLFYLCLIVLLPLAALVAEAAGLGLRGIWQVASEPRVMAALRTSFGLSLAAAVTDCAFGLLIAWVLTRYSFPGRRLLDAAVDLPFALPTAVAGISLATLYAPNGWIGGVLAGLDIKVAFTPLGIFVALIFVALPFAVRTVQPIIGEIDRSLEEASATLGANRFQTVRRVVIPMLTPALRHSHADARAADRPCARLRALCERIRVGDLHRAPVLIVIKLEEFNYPGATAIAVIMLAIAFLMLLAINLTQAWSRRRFGHV
jgi:sulfate/thiosulfate transport system permease protein